MPRNYQRTTEKGLNGNWTEEELKLAIEDVNKNGLKIGESAEKHGIPRSTLHLKCKGWRGRQPTGNMTGGGTTVLSSEEETRLSDNLKVMNKWGFGLTKNCVLDLVRDYVVENEKQNPFKCNRPGKDWFRAFCKRTGLSLKKPEVLEGSRHRQSNDPFIIYDFYDKLENAIHDLQLENKPGSIFNCDESGFKIDPTSTKVVAGKGDAAKRVTGKKWLVNIQQTIDFNSSLLSGGNARKSITVLACVNADGDKLPPLILHQGKRLWDNMLGAAAYPGTSYYVTENGWMTQEVFSKWFKTQFLPQIKSSPTLLIYDGHLSHIGIDIIEEAMKNNVTILKLPPHTSHILQPLDVTVFRGVKSRWDSSLEEWTRHNQGKCLSKAEFSNMLGKIWSETGADVIKKGFEKTGIMPFNRSAISPQTFDPNKLERYHSATQTLATTQVDHHFDLSSIIKTQQEILIQLAQIQNATSQNPTASCPPPSSQSSTFEGLLLKTVTPHNREKQKKKRIDTAEIITSDIYAELLKNKKQPQPLSKINPNETPVPKCKLIRRKRTKAVEVNIENLPPKRARYTTRGSHK